MVGLLKSDSKICEICIRQAATFHHSATQLRSGRFVWSQTWRVAALSSSNMFFILVELCMIATVLNPISKSNHTNSSGRKQY